MSTVTQRRSHGHLGNELLFPMALQGDAAAVAVLEDRGNTITNEKRLRKTRTSKFIDKLGVEHELYQVVEDGKLVHEAVDGVELPSNIVRF